MLHQLGSAKATWEWAQCITVILLSMSQLIQQVLDEHIILGANMMSVKAMGVGPYQHGS